MTLREYIIDRGLTPGIMAQTMGVSRQQISKWNQSNMPTVKTLKKLADTMTELGAPTTVLDIFTAVYNKGAEK